MPSPRGGPSTPECRAAARAPEARAKAACAALLRATLFAAFAAGSVSCDSRAEPTPPSVEAESVAPGSSGGAPPRPPFRDVTKSAGIEFRHENGARGVYHLCEIMSAGGGFLDFDRDGFLDIFLVQSCVIGQEAKGGESRLYRNLRDGNFRDVTAESGISVGGYGFGCAAADYDRDGDADIYVTRLGPDVLLRNEGDGGFTDVTASVGLGDEGFSTSAAWLDYDRDGFLDLYVARYIKFSPEREKVCRSVRQEQDYCNPTAYEPMMHLLYRNEDGKVFRDVSKSAGINSDPGYGLAVIAADLTGDGWVDIYVANDQSPAMLWANQRNGTFVDRAQALGAAFNGESKAIAGMGIAAEDFDGDQDIDLFVTNIREASDLFLRQDKGLFSDVTGIWGERKWLRPCTSFGVIAFDQDLDGGFDMFIANGAVNKDATPYIVERPYAEPNNFLRQNAKGRFVDAAAELPEPVNALAISRGLAAGDYDNDGDLDLLACRNGDTPQLLENLQSGGGHWLVIETLDASGHGPVFNARVTLQGGNRSWVREVQPQRSYLTTSDPRLHFGLGTVRAIDTLRVQWPSGKLEEASAIGVDQVLRLQEGRVGK